MFPPVCSTLPPFAEYCTEQMYLPVYKLWCTELLCACTSVINFCTHTIPQKFCTVHVHKVAHFWPVGTWSARGVLFVRALTKFCIKSAQQLCRIRFWWNRTFIFKKCSKIQFKFELWINNWTWERIYNRKNNKN